MSETIGGNFQSATEGEKNWAIRYGAEPTDLHLAKKLGFPELDAKLNDMFHGGLMAAGNHLYLEVGRIDDQGNFDTLKRIHGFSVKDTEDGTKLATEANGKIVTMVIDGEHTLFSEDPIYQMDPHASEPNQLQSATDNFWFGEDATQVVFQGTQREVMTLYAGLLETTIALNNENMAYDAVQNGAPNGNTIHDVLRDKLEKMAEEMGLGEVGDHDPSGIDHFPWSKKLDIPHVSEEKRLYECAPLSDVEAHVNALEKTAAEQWQAVKDLGQKAEFNQDIPSAAQPPTNSTPSC